MVLLALLFIPLLGSAITWAVRPQRLQLSVLLLCALLHFVLTVTLYLTPEPSAFGGLLALDPLGRLFLGLVSLLFLAVAVYSAKYLTDGMHDPPAARNSASRSAMSRSTATMSSPGSRSR